MAHTTWKQAATRAFPTGVGIGVGTLLFGMATSRPNFWLHGVGVGMIGFVLLMLHHKFFGYRPTDA